MVAVTVQLSREFQDRALAPPRRMPGLIEKLPSRVKKGLQTMGHLTDLGDRGGEKGRH